jgi:hypothetical protein
MAPPRLSLHSSMEAVCVQFDRLDALDLALNPAVEGACFALKMGLSAQDPETISPALTRHRDKPPESGPEPKQQRTRIGSKVNHHRTRKSS